MRFIDQSTGQPVETAPWQDALQVGDFYLIENPVIGVDEKTFSDLPPIYGQILSAEDCEPGFFWVEAYNLFCLEGETGLFCIAEATRQLTEDEFYAALAALKP